MRSPQSALTFLLMIFARWVNGHQLMIIEFLEAENRLLKLRLRGKHIRFADAERALLGRKAKAVGRKALLELDTIVSPDTLMRWHRSLVAQKWYLRRFAAGSVPDAPPPSFGASAAANAVVAVLPGTVDTFGSC